MTAPSAWSDLDGWVYLQVDVDDIASGEKRTVELRMTRETAHKAATVLRLATDKAEGYAPFLDAPDDDEYRTV